jgi:hypothetical protein
MAADDVQAPDQPGSAAGAATYVYGIVGSAATSPRTRGIGDTAVHVLPYERVAALVSDVPLPVRAKRRELLSHSDVLNETVASTAVLPLRFGTTFPDGETVVRELLQPRHDELRDLLAQLQDRVELMVRAFYVEAAIYAEIVRDEPRVARLRDLTRGREGPETHAARVELGSAVAAALEARTRRDAAEILDTLRPFALDLHVDEARVEHQVLHASVLVERESVPAVDAALDALAARQHGRIDFKYVGPLAPHSFVSLGGGAQ